MADMTQPDQNSGGAHRTLPPFISRKVCGLCGIVPPWCDHDRSNLRVVRYYPRDRSDLPYGHPLRVDEADEIERAASDKEQDE